MSSEKRRQRPESQRTPPLTGRRMAWAQDRERGFCISRRRKCQERLWNPGEINVSKSLSLTPSHRTRAHNTHTHTHVYVVLLSCNIGLLLCSDFSIILCALLSRFSSQSQSNVCLLLQRRQNAFSSSPLPASACPGGRDAPPASPQMEAASSSRSLLQGHLSTPSWFSLQGLLTVSPIVMMGD